MFLKDFIGKKIISHDGKIIGYSRSPLFSSGFKKVTALLCANEEEEDFVLPLTQQQIAGDVLLISARKSSKISGMPYSPFLKSVYSTKGTYLGRVSDVRIENLNVFSILTEDKEYESSRIKAFGDCILINTSAPAARIKKSETTSVKQKDPCKKINAAPRPAVLLGKVIKQDVKQDDGQTVLFAKGTTVTPQILKEAALQNKLLDLTVKTLSV